MTAKKPKKKAPAPKPEAAAPRVDGEVRDIHRSQIKNAEYNPRVISDEARHRLGEGIKRFGLVSTLTWNKRSGNLCGGHQRLSVLDAYYGTDDYSVRCTVVDLDEKAEKELNVLLNNQEAQGQFEWQKLGDLLAEIDVEAAGFDQAQVFRLFGGEVEAADEEAAAAQAEEMARKFQETVRSYDDEIKRQNKARDTALFYLVIVFPKYEARVEFTELLGLPDDKYQDGAVLKRLFERVKK